MKRTKKILEITHVQTTRELSALRNVLLSWVKTTLQYCEHEKDDNPWWCNERASLSILSAAAWKTEGWIALEEFCTVKRNRKSTGSRSSKKNRNGRCDLYLRNKTKAFAIEAKQVWPWIVDEGMGKKEIDKGMKAALSDSKELHPDEADVLLAVTFVIPRIRPEQAKQAPTHEQIEGWLGSKPFSSGDGTHPDALAYVFLNARDELTRDKNDCVYPGAALVINAVPGN